MRVHTIKITHGLAIAAGAALAVLPIAAAAADAPVTSASQARHGTVTLNTDAVRSTDGSYIVFLQAGAPHRAMAATMSAVSRAGGSVTREYRNTLNGFAATLPVKAVSVIGGNPNVALIKADPSASMTAAAWATPASERTALRGLPVTSASQGLADFTPASGTLAQAIPRTWANAR